MKKKILGVFVILFVIAILATPVFAVPPTRGTFSQVVVQFGVDLPTESFVTNDINHERGAYSAAYLYGAPWGNSLSGSGGTQTTAQLNLATLTGMTLIKTVCIYEEGTIVGTVNVKFAGWGEYTYTGETFTFGLPGMSGEITNEETYMGILFEGHVVKHGISQELKGLEATERGAGVFILVGPLTGVVVFETTVTYKLPG